MQDLIRITRTEIAETTVPTVNGRDLHAFLEVQHQFRDWIKNRIEEYGFEEGKDFREIFSESTGGRPSKDYALSVDMAKELSMVERTAKGKQARQYFIRCERIAQTMRIEGPPAIVATDTPVSLMAALRTETNPAVQIMLYQQLEKCCRQERLRLPEMGDLVPGGELIPARLFARAIVTIQRARIEINHSRKPALRAYNYSRIHKLAKELGCPLPPKRELIQSLRHSGYFVGERLVDSKLRRQRVLCWVFRRHL